VVNRITDWARITQNDLRKMSGIPSTTFSRSVKARFNPEQSERLVRIIRVIDRAVDLFEGDREAAQKWLNEPNRALSWKVPADLMASETGAYEVIKLITRLEHGVYCDLQADENKVSFYGLDRIWCERGWWALECGGVNGICLETASLTMLETLVHPHAAQIMDFFTLLSIDA
jgi:putative toxin-antitoxin system antitoxin component (TIGR02293 family)